MRTFLLILSLLTAGHVVHGQQVICERFFGTGLPAATGLYTPTADSILITTIGASDSRLFSLGRAQCDTIRLAQIGGHINALSPVIMTKTRQQQLLLFGQRFRMPADSPRLQLQSITRRGTVRWTRRYQQDNSPGGNRPAGVIESPDGGAYFTTGIGALNTSGLQGTLYKVDSTGQLRWQRSYGRSAPPYSFSFGPPTYTRRGTLLLAGSEDLDRQLRAVEVGQHGDSITSRVVLPARAGINYHQTSLRPLRDGGFLLAGTLDTLSMPYTASYSYFVRLDANLNVRWTHIDRQGRTIAPVTFAQGYELADGTLCGVINRQTGFGQFASPLRFVQFSATGVVLNEYAFTTALALPLGEVMRPDYVEPLAADSSWVIVGRTPRMYVGHIRLPGLRAVVPLPPIPAAVPLAARPARAIPTLAAYPNPAHGTLTVPLPAGAGAGQLVVTDALGRVVAQQPVAAGATVQVLAVAGWPPGLYVLTLESAGGRVLGRQRVSVVPE